MKTPTELYQHLIHQFGHYTINELIHLNNDLVSNKSWGRQRSIFRTAVLNALAKKGIDLSPIISRDDGFTTIHVVPVRLSDDNRLVPLS